jgi:Protein of unknown function (DUF2510)
MAEHHMSSTDSDEDVSAYEGLEPGWYTDLDDPTMVRYWDGVTLGQDRHRAAVEPTDAEAAEHGGSPSQVESIDHPDSLEHPVFLAPSDAVEPDTSVELEVEMAGNGMVTDHHDAPDNNEGICVKCEQVGRYYNSAEWSEELRDSAGVLVLMGSKYTDDMTCLECETELDSHHTERWIEVWAQKPRALVTRGKSLSKSTQ